jgi:hypothetical protein
MNCYHAAQGKPKQFTPEEERMFYVTDNLFRGAMIGALANKYVDSYLTFTSAKVLHYQNGRFAKCPKHSAKRSKHSARRGEERRRGDGGRAGRVEGEGRGGGATGRRGARWRRG